MPIAVTSKQVRDVLKSELSTSVPVATPVIAVNASSNQAAPLPSKEGERHLNTPAEGALPLETPKPGGNTERNIIRVVFYHCVFLPFDCSNGVFYIYLSIIATVSALHHEAESRRRTRISLHQEEPAVHWGEWRVNIKRSKNSFLSFKCVQGSTSIPTSDFSLITLVTHLTEAATSVPFLTSRSLSFDD